MFGDLDDHYKPILAGGNSEGTYQFYSCRGDKDRDMSIDTYRRKVTPFLRILIDEKKITDQKIQLDIGINLRHITEDKIITFFIKSANIKCLQSDITDDILQQLITSLYKSYQEDITTRRTDSSLVYESVKGLGIHFHTIDLNRGVSYTPSPGWLKNKGATINPKNTKDNYCFMYALTIAINHKELGPNADRISANLISHIPKYNWDHRLSCINARL